MEHSVAEADRGRLVRVAFGQLDVDLPRTSSIWTWCGSRQAERASNRNLGTLLWHGLKGVQCMRFPGSALVSRRRLSGNQLRGMGGCMVLTVLWTVKNHVDVGRAVILQGYIIITHHPVMVRPASRMQASKMMRAKRRAEWNERARGRLTISSRPSHAVEGIVAATWQRGAEGTKDFPAGKSGASTLGVEGIRLSLSTYLVLSTKSAVGQM